MTNSSPLQAAKPLQSRDVPIYSDKDYWEIAIKYLENFEERKLYRLSELTSHQTNNAFIIGKPDLFKRPFLNHLTTSFTGSCGIATAQSPQELKAFLARQVSPKSSSSGDLLLDELYGSIVQIKGYQTQTLPYPQQINHSDLTRAWRILCLHAHGEGAHANLRNTVLCGQVKSEVTTFPDCNQNYCKRAGHAGGRFRNFSDLAAEEILFLSCSGFSAGREHYSNQASAALSMIASSSVRTVICNDRTVPLTSDEVRLAFLIASEEGLIAACNFLNTLSAPRFRGARPWLLLGDPVTANLRTHRHNVRRLPESTVPGRFYEIEGHTQGSVAATEKTVFIEQAVPSQLILKDITEDALNAEKILGDALALSQTYSLILDSLNERSRETDGAQHLLKEVRNGLRNLLLLFHSWRRARVLSGDSTGQQQLRLAARLNKLASARIVSAFHPFLDYRLEDIIEGMAMLEPIKTGETCVRCGSLLSVSAGTISYTGGPTVVAGNCVTCGPRYISVGTPPNVKFYVESVTTDGKIEILPQGSTENIYAALSLQDKATGSNALSHGPLPVSNIHGSFETTQSLSFDLHTLRILVVSPQGFTINRYRIAR
ncbi:hypothetical protein [Lysinibacter sp. HNR]|uniref:hypothetical protein n=1 Tax=Lysinibacter sp. HNR TaxID=3031408 RepID=UPI002434E0F6|nr:hypothetical protein [Lysinibacter sp. HNR]WGD37589.1 hypothetical protein FrondiHNR_01305 [Lysinibacter sp. HNR]